MEIITSLQNKLIKEASSLSQKKFRDELNMTLVEGSNLLKDLPRDVKIRYLFVTPERQDEAERFCNVQSAYVVSGDVMRKLTDTVTPYGVAAVCDIKRREFALPVGNALLLDGVSDPGNLGTILRTAAACGFDDVYMLDCADIYSPKTVRASLGAIFKLRIYEIGAAEAEELAASAYSCALDMDGKNLFGFKGERPVLLIAGSEAHGIRESLLRAAKAKLGLPMKNQMESLNVAIATAVAMYHFVGDKL